MTNKFLIYDTKVGGYLTIDGLVAKGTKMETSAIYTELVAEDGCIDLKDPRHLQIPVTKEFVDNLPFDLPDIDPLMDPTTNYELQKSTEREQALKGDFVLLTEEGFFSERYNKITETSYPRVRGYDLNEATLYNMDSLERAGNEAITESSKYVPAPIVVPISKEQQENLRKLQAFTENPYGFFFDPVEDLEEVGASLENALNEMESDVPDIAKE